MQKSIYQDETFANFWDERAGDEGEAYKRYVLDPLMFKLVDDFKDKTVLDLGCGNGYLALKLLKESPRHVILADISEHNLRHAAEKSDDPRLEFLQQDVTEPWKVDGSSIDIIYSNMMLNEIGNIKAPVGEAFRTLRKGGVFVFSVTHPAWDLFIYAQEKAGMPSNKIKNLGGYFRRGSATFIMGGSSKTNPDVAKKYGKEFEVEHYQRPLSDYFEALVGAGFTVRRLLEPELTDELLQNNPGFTAYTDNPVGLVFYSTKD